MNKELEMNPNQLVALSVSLVLNSLRLILYAISKKTVSVWLTLCILQETDA